MGDQSMGGQSIGGQSGSSGDDWPTFTVVVPTYNRPAAIGRCVEALSRLDYPVDRFECVVVNDGGSPDDGGESLHRITEGVAGFNLRWISQPNAGPAAARNRGAAEAGNDYLAFTDDDCAPEPGWLRGFAEQFQSQPTALLGGRYCNAMPGDYGAAATQIVNDVGYGRAIRRGQGCGPGDTWLFVTANIAVPRSAFLDVGGFDESFPLAAGEDYDFCHRYQHFGHAAAYCDAAVVQHYHPMKLWQFWRQHFGYGRGLLQFRQRASQRMGHVADRNFGRFQWSLVKYCGSLLKQPGNWIAVGYVAISQVATICGAVRQSRQPTTDQDRG